jgi:hypothetical protein
MPIFYNRLIGIFYWRQGSDKERKTGSAKAGVPVYKGCAEPEEI